MRIILGMQKKPLKQPEVNVASQINPTLTNPIVYFFNFAYYLGAAPFRIVQHNGHFQKEIWRPQQIISAVLHILCTFYLVFDVRRQLFIDASSSDKNPIPYLELGLEFCAFFYKATTMKRLWFNSHDYVRVLNVIGWEKHLPLKSNIWVTKPCFLYTLYGFFTLKALTRVVSGSGFVSPVTQWTPTVWLRRLVERSHFVFGFSRISESVEPPELASPIFWDVVLAILMAFTHFIRIIFSEFCDLFILAFVLTLLATVRSFSDDITDKLMATLSGPSKADGHNNGNGKMHNMLFTTVRVNVTPQKDHNEDSASQYWAKIYQSFKAIHNLSEVVNVALGSTVTWYLAEELIYFSLSLNIGFVSRDVAVKLNYLIFMILAFHIIYLSGDICNKMESVKSWLVNNIQFVPFHEAYIVLHEVIVKDVGIRGNNAFTITFPFAAAYLSLIVTFFIICVQERNESH